MFAEILKAFFFLEKKQIHDKYILQDAMIYDIVS